ncbi:MAG: hypothetical protein QOD77_239 [Thermoplasmata archaeon]|jgi:hypothetical protein|nr:hypothetical protein [Thermoplasmata archaeon]
MTLGRRLVFVNMMLRTALVSLAVAGAFLLSSPSAIAAGGGHSGDVKIHDEATADPEVRNEPHVDCVDFWVEGFNLNAGKGSFEIFSWPPTGDKSLVMSVNWTADSGDDEEGFHFLSGPHALAAGHYRLEVTLDDGKAPKDKMFWVEECEDEECTEDCEPECPVDSDQCPPGECEGNDCPAEPTCPTDLVALARGAGGVQLTFTAAPGSDGSNVYRAEGEGDFEYLATVGAGVGMYVDDTATNGVTYTYMVTSLYGDAEVGQCPQVEVTTIPDLGTGIAVTAAGVLGVAAYAFSRRRKA